MQRHQPSIRTDLRALRGMLPDEKSERRYTLLLRVAVHIIHENSIELETALITIMVLVREKRRKDKVAISRKRTPSTTISAFSRVTTEHSS